MCNLQLSSFLLLEIENQKIGITAIIKPSPSLVFEYEAYRELDLQIAENAVMGIFA